MTFDGLETIALFMTVSVMITTRGCTIDLRRSCRALQQLGPPPLEALITIDGSTLGSLVGSLKRRSPSSHE